MVQKQNYHLPPQRTWAWFLIAVPLPWPCFHSGQSSVLMPLTFFPQLRLPTECYLSSYLVHNLLAMKSYKKDTEANIQLTQWRYCHLVFIWELKQDQQACLSNLRLIFPVCDHIISPQSWAFVCSLPDGSKRRLCVCIHNLLMDYVESCACALMRPYFPISSSGERGYAMITGWFVAMPNLSWQQVQGFQASGAVHVIYCLGFHFKQFIGIWEKTC